MEIRFILIKEREIIINRYIIKIMDIKDIILKTIMEIIGNILILKKKIISKKIYQ